MSKEFAGFWLCFWALALFIFFLVDDVLGLPVAHFINTHTDNPWWIGSLYALWTIGPALWANNRN